MKTVWDAVSELKGSSLNLKEVSEYLYFTLDWFDDGGRYESLSIDDDNDWQLVGTIAEFNALLAEMETNFGKYTGAKFDASKATELEVIKVDVDWGEAPEWAKYEGKPKGTISSRYWLGDNNYQCIRKNGVKNTYGKEYLWDFDSFTDLTPRPAEPQPPVYTQEMPDNGECPKLGAKFEVEVTSHGSRLIDFEGCEVTVIGLSITEDNKQVITFENELIGVGCGLFRKTWIKPLPPKQDLIDGEAYQFYCSDEKFKGIYQRRGDYFSAAGENRAEIILGVPRDECTNITLLTPEEK